MSSVRIVKNPVNGKYKIIRSGKKIDTDDTTMAEKAVEARIKKNE